MTRAFEILCNVDARPVVPAAGFGEESRLPARTHAALPGYAPTELRSCPGLADWLGVRAVLVKDESERLGLPSFKILGASWAITSPLRTDVPTRRTDLSEAAVAVADRADAAARLPVPAHVAMAPPAGVRRLDPRSAVVGAVAGAVVAALFGRSW